MAILPYLGRQRLVHDNRVNIKYGEALRDTSYYINYPPNIRVDINYNNDTSDNDNLWVY